MELYSNCCDTPMQGEPTNDVTNSGIIEGRCADCKEMAVFTNDEESEA